MIEQNPHLMIVAADELLILAAELKSIIAIVDIDEYWNERDRLEKIREKLVRINKIMINKLIGEIK